MATFFGEVIPVTNRAYNDAEDEELATEKCLNPFVATHHQDVKQFSAGNLIVACGQFATAYVDSLLAADSAPLVTLHETDSEDDGTRPRQRPAATLYRLSGDICVCCCGTNPRSQPHRSNWLARTILSQFEQQPTVVILGSAPLAEYFCNSDIYDDRPTMLLRCLTTKEWKLPEELKQLEAPNIVDGLSAAVMTRCRFLRARCALLRLYCSALQPDSETDAAFHQAASALLPSLPPLPPAGRPRHRHRHAPATEHIYM